MALGLRIMLTYGYSSARRLLRGRRPEELLPRGRAARGHPAGGQPPDPVAREAARRAAPRPVRPARRAHRGGPAAVPERSTHARARAAAAGGGLRRERRAARAPGDRLLDRPGRHRPSAPAL